MAAMLKGMGSLKKTFLIGSVAAGSIAISSILYWKYCDKRKKQHGSGSGEDSAESTPGIIPFAKKVVDEAVEKGVEEYRSQISTSGEKDNIELMEKESKDSNVESASSTGSGSSGQSDLSFEKIGDLDSLQQSFVTPDLNVIEDVVTSSLPPDGTTEPVMPSADCIPTDFSIISDDQKNNEDALQTSGQFFLPESEPVIMVCDNGVPGLALDQSGSDGLDEKREDESVPEPQTSSPVTEPLTNQEEVSTSVTDISTSSYDVIKQETPADDASTGQPVSTQEETEPLTNQEEVSTPVTDISTSSYDVIKQETPADDASTSQLVSTQEEITSDPQAAGDAALPMPEGEGKKVTSDENDVNNVKDIDLNVSEGGDHKVEHQNIIPMETSPDKSESSPPDVIANTADTREPSPPKTDQQ